MISKARIQPPRWATGLGYSGLIPFVGLALAVWLFAPAVSSLAKSALLSYSASILSFLGAIHWGLAMRTIADEADASVTSDLSGPMLVWGVIPSLISWVALLLNPVHGLWLVAAGLWACLAVDHLVYPLHGVKTWLPMRRVLTLFASLSCIAAALGATR